MKTADILKMPAPSLSEHPNLSEQSEGALDDIVKTTSRVLPGPRVLPRTGDLPSPRALPSQCIKRDTILCTAARIFARDSFHGASIDLIASEAGVSRQTIYNHYKDKEALLSAVVDAALESINANLFEVLVTFPENGDDLENRLASFAVRLNLNCLHNNNGAFLRRLIQNEGPHLPDLLQSFRNEGPAKILSTIAACMARLALSGHLDTTDPDLAARHFMALINADVNFFALSGGKADEQQMEQGAINGVRTFMRAFGTQKDR